MDSVEGRPEAISDILVRGTDDAIVKLNEVLIALSDI